MERDSIDSAHLTLERLPVESSEGIVAEHLLEIIPARSDFGRRRRCHRCFDGPAQRGRQLDSGSGIRLLVVNVAVAGVSYAALVDRLTDDVAETPRRIVSLPDGSVDHCYQVTGPGGKRLASSEALGEVLVDEVETVPLEQTEIRAGGQAVNAALQIHELGDTAALIGHIDHPILATLPFETHSMGTPSTIRVFKFDDGECLFPEREGRTLNWGIDDLLAVVDWDTVDRADALCCTNWVSFRGLTDVFERLAESPETCPVIVDPGAIGLVDQTAVTELLNALTTADAAHEVVLSVDRHEYETAADIADVTADTPKALLSKLRSTLELTGIVFHGADEAIAATREGTTVVETLEVDEPVLTMGAGDRFSGGLACGLARDWSWDEALALGNACASFFVETGETATRSDLLSFIGDRR